VNQNEGPGQVQEDGTVVFPDRAPPADAGADAGLYSDLLFTDEGTALVAKAPFLYQFDVEAGTFERAAQNVRSGTRLYRQGAEVYLTGEEQVRRYDLETEQVKPPIGGEDQPTAQVVMRGREGGLWVGTRQGLLYFMAPGIRHVQTIEGIPVRAGAAFRQDGETLWASTWGYGLFQLRPRREQVTPGGETRWLFPRSRDGRIHALAEPPMRAGRLWYRWDRGAGWEKVAVAHEAVRGVVSADGVGHFWHNAGFFKHEPAADTARRTLLRGWPVGDSQHHVPGLAPNGDPLLWDEGDLLRLRASDGAVTDTLMSMPSHREAGGRLLTVDATGQVWVPLGGHGLLRVDARTGASEHVLEDTGVRSLKVAGDSLMLARSNEGVLLVDAESGAVRRRITREDGLLSNDINGAHIMGDTLYVGHMSGITLVPTDSLLTNPLPPRAILTGLEVNLDDHSLTDSLRSSNERAVGFSFTGASLTYPDRVQYEVRLAPEDTAWRTTTRRFTRFTNLEPGTYRFEVRARIRNQPPGPPTQYTFTIPPHFYETGWFRLLMVLLVGGLGVGAYRWRVHWLEQRREHLNAVVDERTKALTEAKRKTEAQAERLAELDEAKNRFFAHISHEFRTPLSLILTPLRDALQRSTEGTVTMGHRQLKRMTRNAERLQRLIDQLLDLATLEAGRMTLDRQPGDLARLVRRTANTFASKAEQEDVTLTVETPEAPTMLFDPDKMETIVSNLVANALKFTTEGGRVSVHLDCAPSKHEPEASPLPRPIRLTVRDTGPGIPPEQQEQIFDRFAQAEHATLREHEGTGLGLALTSELVDLHGGRIEIDSSLGEGSTFTVQMPLETAQDPPETNRRMGDGHDTSRPVVDAPAVQAPEASPAVPADATERPVLLVVEDNDEMRHFLHRQLAEDWTVRTAADGEEGWSMLQTLQPDLVLSDVMMPTVNGLELCERIKEDEALRETPVLLLTARAGDRAAVEGLGSGADDFVTKPFDMDELRQRIRNHLAAREHLRARYRDEVELAQLGATVAEESVSFVEEAIAVVEEHLGDPDFTVGRFADEVALSRRQLGRRLKDAVDKPPSKFIRDYRIESAKAQLKTDPETIAEVAYAVGFRSPSHFTQTFQEYAGCTPSMFVERHAG
jgi:signal transduction histidine kinase/DNA-binding response OmpR family regulator